MRRIFSLVHQIKKEGKMERSHWLLLGSLILSLVVVGLTGCVSKSEYEALQAKHAALIEKSDNLTAELDVARTDLTKRQADFKELNAKYAELNIKYEGAKSEAESARSASQAASSELSQIKKVYPPRDFSSLTELRNWLLANPVSQRPSAAYANTSYGNALQIQQDALKDGYIISASVYWRSDTNLYYVTCQTVIDGYVWSWSPLSDEPVQYQGLGRVK